MNPPNPLAGAEVPSPCIDVCRMNPGSGLCEGCGRTLDEIADWPTLTGEQKSAVLARLAARRPPQ